MFYSAFILGLAGSLHCFGMCGPISLLLPANKSSQFKFVLSRFIYNCGRIFTYAFLGFLVGFLGEEIGFALPQKVIFLSLGFVIVLYLITPKSISKKLSLSLFGQKLNSFVKRSMANLHKKHGKSTQFVFGLVNGLIPCGLVYAALSGAFLTAKISDGVLYMVFFGLGTLPMMLSFGWIGSWIPKFVNAKYIYKITYIFLGVFMIYKGLTTPISHYANSHDMTVCKGK